MLVFFNACSSERSGSLSHAKKGPSQFQDCNVPLRERWFRWIKCRGSAAEDCMPIGSKGPPQTPSSHHIATGMSRALEQMGSRTTRVERPAVVDRFVDKFVDVVSDGRGRIKGAARAPWFL
jgi:hypothetical protein